MQRIFEINIGHFRRGITDDFVFMMIDADHFKSVNDSLGHDIGDRLLQDVAERLKQHLPEHALLARLGGDEFIIVFGGESDIKKRAAFVANKVIEVMTKPFLILGNTSLVTHLLNRLALSNLLDNTNEYKPLSLIIVISCFPPGVSCFTTPLSSTSICRFNASLVFE